MSNLQLRSCRRRFLFRQAIETFCWNSIIDLFIVHLRFEKTAPQRYHVCTHHMLSTKVSYLGASQKISQCARNNKWRKFTRVSQTLQLLCIPHYIIVSSFCWLLSNDIKNLCETSTVSGFRMLIQRLNEEKQNPLQFLTC